MSARPVDVEEAERLRAELAEARAALSEVIEEQLPTEFNRADEFELWWKSWAERHAAALKALREAT